MIKRLLISPKESQIIFLSHYTGHQLELENILKDMPSTEGQEKLIFTIQEWEKRWKLYDERKKELDETIAKINLSADADADGGNILKLRKEVEQNDDIIEEMFNWKENRISHFLQLYEHITEAFTLDLSSGRLPISSQHRSEKNSLELELDEGMHYQRRPIQLPFQHLYKEGLEEEDVIQAYVKEQNKKMEKYQRFRERFCKFNWASIHLRMLLRENNHDVANEEDNTVTSNLTRDYIICIDASDVISEEGMMHNRLQKKERKLYFNLEGLKIFLSRLSLRQQLNCFISVDPMLDETTIKLALQNLIEVTGPPPQQEYLWNQPQKKFTPDEMESDPPKFIIPRLIPSFHKKFSLVSINVIENKWKKMMLEYRTKRLELKKKGIKVLKDALGAAENEGEFPLDDKRLLERNRLIEDEIKEICINIFKLDSNILMHRTEIFTIAYFEILERYTELSNTKEKTDKLASLFVPPDMRGNKAHQSKTITQDLISPILVKTILETENTETGFKLFPHLGRSLTADHFVMKSKERNYFRALEELIDPENTFPIDDYEVWLNKFRRSTLRTENHDDDELTVQRKYYISFKSKTSAGSGHRKNMETDFFEFIWVKVHKLILDYLLLKPSKSSFSERIKKFMTMTTSMNSPPQNMLKKDDSILEEDEDDAKNGCNKSVDYDDTNDGIYIPEQIIKTNDKNWEVLLDKVGRQLLQVGLDEDDDDDDIPSSLIGENLEGDQDQEIKESQFSKPTEILEKKDISISEAMRFEFQIFSSSKINNQLFNITSTQYSKLMEFWEIERPKHEPTENIFLTLDQSYFKLPLTPNTKILRTPQKQLPGDLNFVTFENLQLLMPEGKNKMMNDVIINAYLARLQQEILPDGTGASSDKSDEEEAGILLTNTYFLLHPPKIKQKKSSLFTIGDPHNASIVNPQKGSSSIPDRIFFPKTQAGRRWKRIYIPVHWGPDFAIRVGYKTFDHWTFLECCIQQYLPIIKTTTTTTKKSDIFEEEDPNKNNDIIQVTVFHYDSARNLLSSFEKEKQSYLLEKLSKALSLLYGPSTTVVITDERINEDQEMCQQSSGSNSCGVFLMAGISLLIKDLPVDWINNHHIEYFKRFIAIKILFSSCACVDTFLPD